MTQKILLYNPKAVFWSMPLALLALGSSLDRDRRDLFHAQERAATGLHFFAGVPLSLQFLCRSCRVQAWLGRSGARTHGVRDRRSVATLSIYRFPETLEEWAGFDYIGDSNQWLSPSQKREIEHFKFYQRVAYNDGSLLRWPLKKIARWRVERGFYAFPAERRIIEWLRPAPDLS